MTFIFTTFWWLQCYTHAGESLEVPNFVGKKYSEAEKKAYSRDFRVAITDSVYLPNETPGTVIKQNPKALSRVKENRTIYFTITKSNPDLLYLPKLRGVDAYERYSTILSRQGFKPRVVGKRYDPRLKMPTVLQVIYNGDTITTKLEQGFKAEMGATIDLIISDDNPMETDLPDMVCMTYEAAIFILQSNKINIGRIRKSDDIINEEEAYVYRQIPRYIPGATIRVGEQVELWLSAKQPEICQ